MNEYQDILVEKRDDRVGLIRLNRPKAMNALRPQLMDELWDALQAFDADPDVGAVVITGNDRAFSAGADIGEMASMDPVKMLGSHLSERWHRISRIRKPIIAAVSGYCLGGGCELALTCDMIVASETAQFGQPEINIGIMPGAGGTQRLARVLGKYLTMEMVLNDRRLSAQEALQHGLANRVTPVEIYLDEAIKLAASIAARAPVAVQLAKEAVNKAFEMTLEEGLQLEERLFYFLFATEDQKEGMQAFLEKRRPQFQGR